MPFDGGHQQAVDEKRCAHVKAAYEGGMRLGLRSTDGVRPYHISQIAMRNTMMSAARPGRVMRDEPRAASRKLKRRWWCEESQYLPHEACSYGPIRSHQQRKNGVARARAFQDCARAQVPKSK
jgi:hypothetical protein